MVPFEGAPVVAPPAQPAPALFQRWSRWQPPTSPSELSFAMSQKDLSSFSAPWLSKVSNRPNVQGDSHVGFFKSGMPAEPSWTFSHTFFWQMGIPVSSPLAAPLGRIPPEFVLSRGVLREAKRPGKACKG